MSPLRDSFSIVSARFHLVGLYALASLMARLAEHWAGQKPSPEHLLLVLGVSFLYIAVEAGVLGSLFQTALPPAEALSFTSWASALFFSMLWLRLKMGVLGLGLVLLPTYALVLATGREEAAVLEAVAWWGMPALLLIDQVLFLYAAPLCILARVRREWRPAIRPGLRLMRSNPAGSFRLVLLLAAATGAQAAAQMALGPDAAKTPPGYGFGLAALAGSSLTLVAFLGATRLVLAGRAAAPPVTVSDAAAPGPPA